jgi:L-iditol 2-dehydrogenase
VDEGRLALARKLGADRTVNVQQENALAIVESMTDGYGADVVCECSGAEGSAQALLPLARRGARFAQVGLYGKPIRWDLEQVPYMELIVTGGNASTPSSWRRALDLLSTGQVQTECLVSHRLPITQWEQGFDVFRKKAGGKILLIPEA